MQLDALYRRAFAANTYGKCYAAANRHEYMAELMTMWMNVGEHSCFPGMRRGEASPRAASAGSCASGRRTLGWFAHRWVLGLRVEPFWRLRLPRAPRWQVRHRSPGTSATRLRTGALLLRNSHVAPHTPQERTGSVQA